VARPIASKRRKPMSRDRVLQSAIDLADREGIEALTMRRLAQELGVEAMTLYHYVAGKEEILGGMIDLVAHEVPLPDPGADGKVEWKAATRQRAIAAREVLLRHPWAGALWNQVRVGPGRIHYMDSALRTFREGGLSPEVTERAFHAVENHILGYTLQAQAFLLPDEDLAAAGQAFLQSLPTDEFPWLVEHVVQHLEKGTLDEGDFEFGLDLILDGVERMAASGESIRKPKSKKRSR
jgi:AcrR family transcriptional regulator